MPCCGSHHRRGEGQCCHLLFYRNSKASLSLLGLPGSCPSYPGERLELLGKERAPLMFLLCHLPLSFPLGKT